MKFSLQLLSLLVACGVWAQGNSFFLENGVNPNGLIVSARPASAYDISGNLWIKTGANNDSLGWSQLITGDTKYDSCNTFITINSSGALDAGGLYVISGVSSVGTLFSPAVDHLGVVYSYPNLTNASVTLAWANDSKAVALLLPKLTNVGMDFDASFCDSLTSIDAQLLVSVGNGLAFNNGPLIRGLLFNSLSNVGASLDTRHCDSLVILNFGSLTNVGATFWGGSSVSLKTLNIFSLQNVGQQFSFNNCYSLTRLNLPALTNCGAGITMVNCVSLTNVSFPNYLPANATPLNFSNCALNQSSVDHVLARCVANTNYVSGTVTLNGGTNSTPSTIGSADAATLVARGCVVSTN